MLVKNTTDFFHAATHTSRRPPQPDMVIIVRGTFTMVHDDVMQPLVDLEQAFMSGPQYADGDDARRGALLHPNDFADMKLCGEVLLIGSAYPPKRGTVTCPVRLSLGQWRKELMVHGDRRWDRGLTGSKMSEPSAFDSIPLDYVHAYGGGAFAANPVGRGHADDDRLPNVEVVAEPILERSQTPTPGSYAPINPTWPQRKRFLGKQYGAAYQRTRAPYYAADHNWQCFSAAPKDQQIQGYWKGDEMLVLQNLHPEQPVFRTRLPGLRLRAFVKDDHGKSENGTIRPVNLVLDTVLCEPDAGTVKLTWRGLIEVQEDDLCDVTHVYLASEPLGSEPLSDAHYHEALEAFAKDPTGVLAAIPKDMIDEYDRQEKIRRGEAVPDREVDPELDPIQTRIKQKLGPLIDDDTLAVMGEGTKALDSVEPVEGAEIPDVARSIAELPDPPTEAPMMTVIKPGRLPNMNLRRRMREITEQVEKLREADSQAANDVSALDLEIPKEHSDSADGRRKAIEDMAAIPHEPHWKQLDPEYEPPGPLSTDAPGPGADLRERDLSGQDLRGIDLSGANLERANLCRTDLSGANLEGANLRWAELYLTELNGANLRRANLELANCICVHAADADFTGATMSEACLEDADLAGAKLADVVAEYCVFEKADLRASICTGARFDHSDFSHAKLQKADFRKASAVLCLFAECEADALDLTDAVLTQASFVEATAKNAIFIGATLNKAFFMHATLDGADFGYADLSECHLTQASAKATRFYGANLRGARLYRTNLDGAQLVAANLMGVDARKARVDKTNFAKSNLYDARLLDIRGDDYDLTGCNLERARVEPRT